MGWGRDERDAWDGITRLGDDIVDFESRQLTALTRLRTLCHLNLYLFGVHQILSRHAKATAGNLLGLAGKADTVHFRVITNIVLTALTSVRACAELVHSQGQCLVGLDAQGTKAHSACHEVLHDRLHALYLVNRRRLGSLFPAEEVADKDRAFLFINNLGPILEFIVIALSRRQLQLGDCLRVPSVQDTVLAPGELSLILQEGLFLGCLVQTDGITGNFLQSDTADGACFCSEVSSQQVLAQADAFEDLRTAIAADGRNTHLRHNLLQTLIHSLDVILLSRSVFLLDLAFLHQIIEDSERHIRAQRTGTIAQQQRCVHRLADLATLYYQGCLHTFAHADEIVMHGTHSQQTWDGRMLFVDVPV